MTFETKEQVLEKILEQPKPSCSHCNEVMTLWEVPPINFSDGLGWGTPYLYICFNDDCTLYVNGWKEMKENYTQTASYRCMCYPGTQKYELIPVFSPTGAKGQTIDNEILAQEEALKASIKKGFSILAGCWVDKDTPTILQIVMDPTQPARVRLKAGEMIGDLGDIDAIEPLSNLKLGNKLIEETIAKSIQKIHHKNFTRECPFCAEVIKKRAHLCKHCGKDVAGQ